MPSYHSQSIALDNSRMECILAIMTPTFNHSPLGPLSILYSRPGFLFRRAHQIADGIFIDECSELGLTPPQHSVLIAVAHHPGINQAEVARLLGFDRATVGQVVRRLATRHLLRRPGSPKDKRNKAIELTEQGERLLRRASAAMARISRRLMAPLRPQERTVLLELLESLINDLNSASRTPLRPLRSLELEPDKTIIGVRQRRSNNRRRARIQS